MKNKYYIILLFKNKENPLLNKNVSMNCVGYQKKFTSPMSFTPEFHIVKYPRNKQSSLNTILTPRIVKTFKNNLKKSKLPSQFKSYPFHKILNIENFKHKFLNRNDLKFLGVEKYKSTIESLLRMAWHVTDFLMNPPYTHHSDSYVLTKHIKQINSSVDDMNRILASQNNLAMKPYPIIGNYHRAENQITIGMLQIIGSWQRGSINNDTTYKLLNTHAHDLCIINRYLLKSI